MDLLGQNHYNRPMECKNCGGVMIFKGVGEYQCENCRAVEYDDYGKVRLYIEQNRGATASQIEAGTGVSQRNIRQLLREGRIEIAKDSNVFLRCELCGTNIRSGRFCPSCEKKYHQSVEAKLRDEKLKNFSGVGMAQKTEEGEKRFTRDK